MKVSVVVAVYNPGRHLRAPVDSFLRQTLPPGEFEVVFVDDGSTDGSGRRLDRLARKHPHFRVLHIPNSGWPGRPRNLGIGAARGRYVLFVDHDDWLEDDALAYLWSTAEEHGADVVIAREIGHGFGVPRRMFRRTIPDATLGTDDILALLTPHKLFRRSMLVEHDIRFPEGPRRLEDHHFVIQAYLHARRITVTGDHPVYHWAKRDEGTNATRLPFARDLYYDNLRDILDIVDAHTGPGPFRDGLYAHWLRYKMIHKLLRPHFRRPGSESRALYAEVRRLMEERFAPAVDRQLPVGYRLVAKAVRADRLDLVIAAAHLANGLRLRLDSASLTPDEGGVEVGVAYELRDDEDVPIRVHRAGGGLRWDPPAALLDGLALEDEALVVDEPMGELALVLRQRGTDRDHDRPVPLPATERGDGVFELAGAARVGVDPATFAAGSRLPDGTWDASIQVEFGGFRARARLPARMVPAAVRGDGVRPYATQNGSVAFAVGDARAGQAAGSRSRPAPHRDRVRRVARRLLPASVRRLGRRALDRVGR
jgi:poly(ribitol-phosphate) beta-N-acetylglucosaminyltransferase